MSSDGLNPLSYLVLALVGRGGAGPHDLVEMMRLGGRLYWAAAPSKLYAEPKRLRALGYLDAHAAPGRTRARTVYSLTKSGERALREWIGEPSSWPRIQHEAIVRVLAGDIADDAALADSLAAMRSEIDELDALNRESAAASTRPSPPGALPRDGPRPGPAADRRAPGVARRDRGAPPPG